MKRRPGYWESTPWKTNEDEMAKKSAVRALAKYLPKSTELGKALESDEQKVTTIAGLDELNVQPVEDVQDAEVVEETTKP
jgi:recombination protein RecT